jgi:hypothetical protein
MFKKSKSSPDADDKPPTRSPREIATAANDSVPDLADFSYEQDDEDEAAGSAEETARYIADMVGALAAMAGEARLDLLTYLLNMARVEAELQARQSETLED